GTEVNTSVWHADAVRWEVSITSAYVVPTACAAARYLFDFARRVAQKNHLYLRNTEQAIQSLSSKLVSDIT
ncbi:hypothetical protein, partial [Pseudenterobacter timonensis]